MNNDDLLLIWDWYGQEVDGPTVHLITKLMDDGLYYMFAGLNKHNGRLWTLDKGQAAVFSSDLEAWKVINKYFHKSEHNKILIKIET